MTALAWFALLERVHGHVAWLGLVLLLHPVVSLSASKQPRPYTRFTAELAATLLTVVTLIGWWIYPDYRSLVKSDLLSHNTTALWAFEAKEHLAWMSWLLAVSGASVLRCVGHLPEGRELARTLLALAVAVGVLVGAVGTWVAAAGQGVAG